MLFPTVGARPPAPTPSVQQLGESIRNRFVRAARDCGAALPFVPAVTVDSTKTIDVHYSNDDRTVHFTDWANLNEDSRAAITAWADKGTLGLSPEGMYREMFNSFIAPHELGHYLQDVAKRWKGMSGWDAELEANRIGIAFWSLQPGAEGKVEARVENITRFLDDIPSPVLAGDTAEAFFNRNYAAFSRGEAGPLNAMNYSWFQALMFKTALRERGDHTFCQLVALNRAT
ncbi:hypothetical protein LK533_08215 [Sphingomonas sp. PL-96]|uniref:hypothetical protein n=1 Tax=Sphingomonas sp. PL-96 TaxID=2887201 RepID=UPI001E4BF538|nr:hypothetical protein [Sphingomonas sp. PL-96]MCC2976659.1 hypothetical protein [Sphingomonas sp. PL-96]